MDAVIQNLTDQLKDLKNNVNLYEGFIDEAVKDKNNFGFTEYTTSLELTKHLIPQYERAIKVLSKL